MCLPKILFPVFMFAFIFSLPLIFIWPLAFLIFSPPLWNFYVSLPTKFVSFVFTRFSCSSVIHVSVNIKDNIEKDTTLLLLLLLFLSKRPGGHATFFRCIWVAIPVDEFFYIGVPVVRTDVRWRLSSSALPAPPPPSPLHLNVDAPPPSNGPSRQITSW